ncbi:hypothetical protein D3C84_1129500 [compost metagenome]
MPPKGLTSGIDGRQFRHLRLEPGLDQPEELLCPAGAAGLFEVIPDRLDAHRWRVVVGPHRHVEATVPSMTNGNQHGRIGAVQFGQPLLA